MIKKARETYKQLGLEDKVTLLEDRQQTFCRHLMALNDFIFMDSAKSKYIEFLFYRNAYDFYVKAAIVLHGR